MTADGPTMLPWRVSAERALRELAAITIAGAVLGVLVGGVGGRLAMMLLARLNPRTAGVLSDDGFVIGQFTLAGSAQLLGAAWQFGLLGAFVYTLVRGLMIGPRWFRVLSVSLGAAVVVGAVVVHTDGVDFTLLRPVPLTVGLFLAIPAVYAALLTLVAETWIAKQVWPVRARLGAVVATLLLWLPLLPLLPVLAGAWLLAEWVRRHGELQGRSRAVLPWLARTVLAVVFVLAVADLVRDVRLLS